MKVFISWSGRRSGAVAEALRGWLPQVIQAAEPWLSGTDLSAGSRWFEQIGSKLEECNFGIICLTADNVTAPWILFEAGALSKSMDKALLCPYLLDVRPVELSGPVAQFQAVVADKEGTKDLLGSINQALESPLATETLDGAFGAFWPRLEHALKEATALELEKQPPPRREEQEILEEILQRVRGLAPGFSTSTSSRADDIASVLKNKGPHSFKWFREATPINLPDAEFERIIKEHPERFEQVNIIQRNDQGEREIPGRPGIRLRPKIHEIRVEENLGLKD